MASSGSELKGQNASVVTFDWGNIRIDACRYRQRAVVEPSTGTGDGDDAKHISGVKTRQFSFSGLVVDGVPEFDTDEGTFKLDLTGDNSKTVEGNLVMQEMEFTIRFGAGARINVQGAGVVDGAPTYQGTPS